MSKTEAFILTEKERQAIIDKFKHYDLFGNLPHVPVKGIVGWPPAEKAGDKPSEAAKKKA
ncbi:MAG: hypothetical protein K9G33_07830 [Sneathiella sp.]|nr:hypothetical protein [Sneathiella sp.]